MMKILRLFFTLVLCTCTGWVFAQQGKTITGTVTDGKGEPVIGVTVSVQGTRTYAATNAEGAYAITPAAKDGVTLVFSFIGYQTQAVEVAGRSVVDVVLVEESTALDQVVVVGFGVQKKSDLTGAVSTVRMDDILGERPVTSVSAALQGAIPGLRVSSTSGRPGEEMTFNIRGTNNLDGNGAPLILVDNVELDLSMVDPNEIESVTVLKDGASAAIYGARAAFGVILITTKKGDRSTMKVNYSNNFAFTSPTNMPKKATPLQTVQLYKDMGTVNYQTGQNVDTWLRLLNEYNNNPSAYPQGYAMDNGLRYSLAETDLLDDMMEGGFQQSHNVSASGTVKDVAYRMAFGVLDEDGVLAYDKDTYKRYNVSSYISSSALKWVTPELDIKYSNSENAYPYSPASYGIWGAAIAFPSYAPMDSMEIDGEEVLFGSPRNHIALSAPRVSRKNNARIFGKVTVSPAKDLKLIGEYTFTHSSREATSFNKKYSYAHVGNFTKETSVSESKYEFSGFRTNYNALNLYANYTKVWEKHELTAMAGFNQESSRYQSYLMNRTNMINEELPSISQSTGDYYAQDGFSEFGTRSLFYRLNYSFAGKYLLSTSGRYDGSSKFPKKGRFGFFPSASAAWIISKEKFMKDLAPTLSNLKLRASWSEIGNQSIQPYTFIPGMGAGKTNWVVNGLRVTTLGMPDLVSDNYTWEKVASVDVGLEAGFFKNALVASVDYYIRDTKGMLAPGAELPGVLGTDAPMQNTADLRSKGWEVEISWNGKVGNVFYNLGFNIFDSQTEITKYNNTANLISGYRKGMKLGEIWGYETDRLYTQDDFVNGVLKEGIPALKGYNPNPGDVLYRDLNGDGVIDTGLGTEDDPGDRRIIGNSTPRFQYGFRGTLGWKGLNFSFFLQGVGKADRWIMNDLYYPHKDAWTTLYSTQLDYWTPERTDSFFPRIYDKAAGNTGANQQTQTRYLSNVAFLALRNLTVDYTFPAQWMAPLRISRLSVFCSMENVAKFHHLPQGIDPEGTSVSGGTFGERGFTYPYMRKIALGINLTF